MKNIQITELNKYKHGLQKGLPVQNDNYLYSGSVFHSESIQEKNNIIIYKL